MREMYRYVQQARYSLTYPLTGVNCPEPVTREHIQMLGAKAKYLPGDAVRFSCKANYKLLGKAILLCGEEGQWDYPAPRCGEIKCDDPPRVPHTNFVRQPSYPVDTVMEYTCQHGYFMDGRNTIRCLADGQWEVSRPSCSIITCGPPIQVDHATHIGENHTFASVVEYQCEDGYLINGPSVLECLVTSIWNDSAPNCEIVQCPVPEDIENGFLIAQSIAFGSVITYACNTGYLLNGIPERSCGADGQWSGQKPTCNPVNCGPPDDVPHATITGEEHTFGQRVTYTCDLGYARKGAANRLCQSDGTWQRPLPLCLRVKCPVPEEIPNGRFEGSSFFYNDTIQYECNTGYSLEGAAFLACQSNGSWSHSTPSCQIINCGEPPSTDLAKIIPIGNPPEPNSYGSDVLYVCRTGYEVIGTAMRRCQADRSWSGLTPSCGIVECAIPGRVANGHIKGSNYTYGSSVEYVCEDGYTLSGAAVLHCSHDKTWNGSVPSCVKEECPQPGAIAFGRIVGEELTFGSSVTYKCNNGYKLDGAPQLTCLAGGVWDKEVPICIPILCDTPSLVINNGRLLDDTGNYTYGTTIRYKCDPGYFSDGAMQRTCEVSGRWSGSIPVCEKVSCPVPLSPRNGYINGYLRKYQDNITYSCKPGFELIGPSMRLCRANATWSGPVSKCDLIVCPNPPAVQNGNYILVKTKTRRRTSEDNYLLGDKLKVRCREGYKVEGPQERKCRSNRTWSGEQPVCVSSQCRDLSILHGRVVGRRSIGEIVVFSCDVGFILEGSPRWVCDPDSNWLSENGEVKFPTCRPAKCPQPNEISNGGYRGRLNGRHRGRYPYEEVITYFCDRGYELIGDSERKCGADELWSSPEPRCEPLSCEAPPSIPNGQIVASEGYKFGSSIQYVCADGFELVGSGTITCLANKEWSMAPPKCRKNECYPPPHLPNGRALGNSRGVGDEVSYICNKGYTLVGVTSRTCLRERTWSTGTMECTPTTCANLSRLQIENGKIIGDGSTFGDTVEYLCNDGYETLGKATRECLADGSWSFPVPICRKIACPIPRSIQHGTIHGWSYGYKDVITYTCHPGFELIGESRRQCLSDGQWSGDQAECLALKCPAPDVLDHGTITGTLRVNDTVKYKCDAGYYLTGDAIRSCKLDQTWSGTRPLCNAVTCPQPQAFENGNVIGNSYTFQSSIRYTCKEGYELLGEAVRHCQADGTWTADSAPTCIPVYCIVLINIPNGKTTVHRSSYQGVVEYTCNYGFRLVGDASRSCQADGEWSGEEPRCEEVRCPPPEAINSGNIRGGSLKVGAAIQYVCDPLHVLEGSDTRRCLDNGTWSGQAPVCVMATCPRPPNIQHGKVTATSGFTIGSTISFRCKHGYQVTGAASLMCTDTRSWSSPFPTCERLSCGHPGEVAHASIRGDSFSYGDVIDIECAPGFVLFGKIRATLFCRSTGKWSASLPECVPENCGAPPAVDNAQVVGDNYQQGEHVYYTCDSGHELSGNNLLTCGARGVWEGTLPTCHAQQCPPPPIIPFASVTAYKTFSGQTVRYRCNRGYVLTGESVISCGEDRVWSNAGNTACVPIDCGQPPVVPMGRAYFQGVTYGSTVNYTCGEGYAIEGATMLKCEADSTWSPTPPNCIPSRCNKPQVPANARMEGNDNKFLSTIVYTCFKGYLLVGDSRRSCTADGSWSGEAPRCESK